MLRLGIGNVMFVTFAAMIGIMAVLGLCKILGKKNIPILTPVANYVDNAWQMAA